MTPTTLPILPCRDCTDARIHSERYAMVARDIRSAAGHLAATAAQAHGDQLAELAESFEALAARYEALADELADEREASR